MGLTDRFLKDAFPHATQVAAAEQRTLMLKRRGTFFTGLGATCFAIAWFLLLTGIPSAARAGFSQAAYGFVSICIILAIAAILVIAGALTRRNARGLVYHSTKWFHRRSKNRHAFDRELSANGWTGIAPH